MLDFNRISSGIPNFKFSSSSNVGDIITRFVPYLLVFAGLALLIYLVYGGFKWMVAGGNPDKLQAAKTILTNGLIGFLVIFLAYWLIQIVGIISGITDIQNTFR